MRSEAITTSILFATALTAALHRGAVADEPGFARRARFAAVVPEEPSAAAGAERLERDGAERRVYLSGMLGIGTAAAPAVAEPESPLLAGTLFGGNSAVGIAAPRPWGQTRVECEARGRTPAGTGPDERWRVMANLWHDVSLTDRLAIYGGGGAGPGGTHAAGGAGSPAGLAWQVGAGVAYDLGERLTLDVGYRYGGIESRSSRDSVGPAGEAVIAVRIHDPFRGWWERRGAATRPAAGSPAGG